MSAVEHEHAGPDWRCEACKPLAEVLRRRMTWASMHWGDLHADAFPSLARAIHESPEFAALIAEAERRALMEAADEMSRRLDTFAMGGRHTRARWAEAWLRNRAEGGAA